MHSSSFKRRPNAGRSLATVAILLVSILGVKAQQPKHPASTPAERARAVQIAQALEANPTDPELRDDAAWLVRWVTAVPDLTVSICSANLPWKSKYKYSTDLTAVTVAATTAFVIKHSDDAKDPAAAGLAAMEAEARAYQKVIDADPKGHSKEMDEIVEIQKQGKLAEYMHDRWTQMCKK